MAMRYKWRLYADANIDQPIVSALRSADFDVLYVPEESRLQRQQDDRFHFDQARRLKRYLLTKDEDFWWDTVYPLHESPGVILIAGSATEPVGSSLLRLLRKLLRDYNPISDPLFLQGTKIRVSEEGIAIRLVDHDTQQKVTDFWAWRELY